MGKARRAERIGRLLLQVTANHLFDNDCTLQLIAVYCYALRFIEPTQPESSQEYLAQTWKSPLVSQGLNCVISELALLQSLYTLAKRVPTGLPSYSSSHRKEPPLNHCVTARLSAMISPVAMIMHIETQKIITYRNNIYLNIFKRQLLFHGWYRTNRSNNTYTSNNENWKPFALSTLPSQGFFE